MMRKVTILFGAVILGLSLTGCSIGDGDEDDRDGNVTAFNENNDIEEENDSGYDDDDSEDGSEEDD